MIGAGAVAAVCALVAAWLLLITTPAAINEGTAFEAAVRCEPVGEASDEASGDCLRTVGARVDRTEQVEGRKTPSYRLYVDEPDGTTGRTTLGGSPAKSPAATPGARVEVTYWRGQIRYVDFEAGRKYTHADPRDDYKLFAAWGLAVGLYGTGFLWCWYWLTRRARLARRAQPWQLVLFFLAATCLAVVGGFAPWATDDMGAALLLVGQATAVTVAVCSVAAVFLWRRQGGDETIDVPPSVPAEEKHFAGQILGEVPYADRGTHLVAGAGYLASTPGHAGMAHRRSVPGSLTPIRVRHPYWTDPSSPAYEGRAWVLECEDDGVPVLIVTHRKHMPWVVGALAPRP
ncbi:hypothetical protein KUF83_20805 [Streptomyces sp. BV286]|uniref:hypothetical protein n=1 Tax=unclassified Streptomyces TaxID=2593676 RepID=UPI001C2DF6E0|nr:hypothetical protein [Streptomyces sp. BV286]MBV1938975.1 hypothetical protein [Streptomyces sp. BV286]